MFDNNATTGSYKNEVNKGFRQTLTNLAETFQAKNLDYVTDITSILKIDSLRESYMDVLFEDYEQASTLQESTELTEDFADTLIKQDNAKLKQLAESSIQEMLSEAQLSNQLKPIVGLTLPLLKLYWVKNVFKDFIKTEVVKEHDFIRSIERQYVDDANNVRHWLPEALLDPSLNLYDAARQKIPHDKINIPQSGFDLITLAGGSRQNQDQISVLFFIDSITYMRPITHPGDSVTEEEYTKQVRVKAQPGTGMFRYVIMEGDKVVDTLMGDIDFSTGYLNLACTSNKIKSVTIDGALSSENHLRTLDIGWDKDDYSFSIPDTPHISTGLTVERIKDENVIYNQDTQAKVLEQMNNVLAHVKDGKIRDTFEESADRLRGTNYFRGIVFDCKPPADIHNYSPVDWRTQLKDTLDSFGLELSSILQNENIIISVIGNPKDIRLFQNVTWIYGKDSEVGGCKLDYQIGLFNNQRNFRIGSTWKMKQGKIRFIIQPMDDTQMTYQLFEYQFFISNEYSDPKNVRIKSVMACDRYLVDEVTPVQGELEIKNNTLSISEMYA